MAQLAEQETQPLAPPDGSHFMHPFVMGATAFVAGQQIFYFLSRGRVYSPDKWGNLYLLILGAYAGGTEVKRWMARTATNNSTIPEERWQKGGPIVTLWCVMILAAGLWRMADDSRPMPPELEDITFKVVALFFGTYALRQVRKRAVRGTSTAEADSGTEGFRSNEGETRAAILNFLRARGPASTRILAESLTLPRRTLLRLLKEMTAEGLIVRDARSPEDPAAAYRLK